MNKNRGLTLIEIIVVIAIFGLIIVFGLTLDLSSFKRSTFHSEQRILVSVLEKARSRSLNNMFGSVHGFCYIAPNYVIFRDRVTCLPTSTTDEIVPANINIASNLGTTFPIEIVFAQLTGKLVPQLTPANNELVIHITDGIKSADIKINNEGTINW
ncbi:MAG: type II secretion system protein [Patescibacteria group bacterium]